MFCTTNETLFAKHTITPKLIQNLLRDPRTLARGFPGVKVSKFPFAPTQLCPLACNYNPPQNPFEMKQILEETRVEKRTISVDDMT